MTGVSRAAPVDEHAAEGLVGTEQVGAVLVATLARPPVNAIDDALLAQLESVLDAAEADERIAVLHLRSAQKVFCAGADLALMRASFATPQGTAAMVAVVERMQRVFARLESAPILTIAEIGGAALGGGFELALACDLRIAAREAVLGLPEARLGLLPAAGGTQRLTRLAGPGVAKRLILGAETIDGGEAERLGLVHWAVPRERLADAARELSARCAHVPRAALAENKQCIALAGVPGDAGFAAEIAATSRLYQHPETRRRVSAFLDQRANDPKEKR
ncbi:MAG: enoyl-CoA hydratase/isomerase family protein [Burkholderiales bacterium]|jgi:enoyl-CoA hydratase/carnithine racemase|nr:enoyl-CoA hydratase/isomerase family protein [Burkholderiales bacterium]